MPNSTHTLISATVGQPALKRTVSHAQMPLPTPISPSSVRGADEEICDGAPEIRPAIPPRFAAVSANPAATSE